MRIDYLAPTVYLTDIIAFFLIVLNFKIILKFLRGNRIIFLIIFLFIINCLFSLSPFVSLYRLVKFFELAAIGLVFYHWRKKLNPKTLLISFFTGTVFELILVIIQFISKHSVQGLFYFFGERYFTLSTPGIAKAAIQGIEFLRPYGTFSHPNSMAGFYLLVYFFVISRKIFTRFIILKNILLAVCALLVLFSFSKTAIAVFLILNIVHLIFTNKKNVCRICVFSRLFVFTVLALVFLTAQTDPASIQNRWTLMKNSVRIFTDNPLLGTGLGGYLVAQNKIPLPFSYFFQQPVHNIFLLWLSEAGIIINAIIVWFITKTARNTVKQLKINNKFFLTTNFYLLSTIFLTGFFDHYWLTLQQNFLLLGVMLALTDN